MENRTLRVERAAQVTISGKMIAKMRVGEIFFKKNRNVRNLMRV